MTLFLPHSWGAVFFLFLFSGSSTAQQPWRLLCRGRALWGRRPSLSGLSLGADWLLCPQHIQEFINETWWARTGQPLPDHLVLFVWSLIVSLYPLGGLFGALLAGPLAVMLGR